MVSLLSSTEYAPTTPSTPGTHPSRASDCSYTPAPERLNASSSTNFNYLHSMTTSQHTQGKAVRGRSAHIIDRLAFWRKRRPRASDVQNSMQAVVKAHERYRKDLCAAYETLQNWADYISPTSHANEDTFRDRIDGNIGEKIVYLLDAMKPVIHTEREAGEAHAGLAHSFQAIKQQEEGLKSCTYRQKLAERKYFKAVAYEIQTPEMTRLSEECQRLTSDVEDAAIRLHKSIKRELPLRFHQYSSYYSSLAYASNRASDNIKNALRDPEFPLCGTLSFRDMGDSEAADIESQTDFYSPRSPYTPQDEVAPLQLSHYSGLQVVTDKAPSQPEQTATSPIPDEVNKNSDTEPKHKLHSVGALDMADFSNDNFVWT